METEKGKTTLTITGNSVTGGKEKMFEDLICTLIGHDLEAGEDRENGPLPKFECRRCGREVSSY